jgi:hypothetical protein
MKLIIGIIKVYQDLPLLNRNIAAFFPEFFLEVIQYDVRGSADQGSH